MKYRNMLIAAVVAGLAGVASEGIAAGTGTGLHRTPVPGTFGQQVPPAMQALAAPMVIQDGGFEASYDDGSGFYINDFWGGSSTNYGTPFCDAALCGDIGITSNSGTFWAWFADGDVAESASALQSDVLIPDGGSAALSFYLALPDCGASQYSFAVTVDATQVWGFDQNVPPAECGVLAYAPVSVDISGFADGLAHTVEFAADIANDGVMNIFVDDVAITEAYRYFRPGQAVNLPPPDADCDNTGHFGRMIVDKNTGALWMCTNSGWQTMATAP